MSSFQQLVDQARREAAISALNVDELLNTSDDDDDRNISLNHIQTTVQGLIRRLGFSPEITMDICERLVGYKLIDEIHELITGRYIRWVRRDGMTPKLDPGGMLSDIKFMDDGVHVVSITAGARFPRKIRYDNYWIFQKLTDDELLVGWTQDNLSS